MTNNPNPLTNPISTVTRLFGLGNSHNSHLDFDPAEYRDVIKTGYPIGPNTFAHEVRKAMLELQDEFDITFPLVKDEEPTLRSNPLRVDDMVPKMRDQMIARRRALADYVNGMIHIYSNAGTGWLLWQQIQEEIRMGASLDFLVQTHQLQQARGSGDPAARRRLLAALGYVHIDAGTILMDQPLRRYGYAGVPAAVAKIVMSLGHFDWGDLENGVYTVGYTTVPIGEQHLRAGQVDQDQIVGEAIEYHAHNVDLLFDPSNWAFWRDNPEQALPTSDNPERIAIVPKGFEAVNGAGVDIAPIHADVDQPHVLVIQRVDDMWLNELKREGIEHVDELLRAGDNSLAAEWENMCEKFGVSDSEARWEEYRRRHIDHKLD